MKILRVEKDRTTLISDYIYIYIYLEYIYVYIYMVDPMHLVAGISSEVVSVC